MLYPVRPDDEEEEGRVGEAEGEGAGEAEQHEDEQDDEGVIEEAVSCKPARDPHAPTAAEKGRARGHAPTVPVVVRRVRVWQAR